jgi:hypothetical protein
MDNTQNFDEKNKESNDFMNGNDSKFFSEEIELNENITISESIL